MPREQYLRLARQGLKMPIGADLVLRERLDAEQVLLYGAALGAILVDAARRYRTPLAFPVMDLRVEKAAMLQSLAMPEASVDSFHFDNLPSTGFQEWILGPFDPLAHPRARANADAIRVVARERSLTPVGMVIGPFSLTTKLLADPITPVFLAGAGATREDDEEVHRLEILLQLATAVVCKSVRAQVAAGASAIVVCEPAANNVFFSPLQLAGGSDIFDRYAITPNRHVNNAIHAAGEDLIFHCCGELVDSMLRRFCLLNPVMLSLGSSRRLWEDASIVPKTIVLYGNLPSKKFSSDSLSCDNVRQLTVELTAKMREVNHPFILGSECDVLSVPGSESIIKSKVAAMCCACDREAAVASV